MGIVCIFYWCSLSALHSRVDDDVLSLRNNFTSECSGKEVATYGVRSPKLYYPEGKPVALGIRHYAGGMELQVYY
ncbi:hypothetical protein Trydic_g16134 [Trypoxylus dichotomus]